MNRLMMMLLARGGVFEEAGADGAADGGGAAAPATPTGQQPSSVSDAEAKLLQDVMRWKEKARNAQASIDAAQAEVQRLKALEEATSGLTTEELRQLVADRKEAERQEAERRGEYERIVGQMREENQRAHAEWKTQLETVQSENLTLKQEVEKLTIGQQFATSKFIRKHSVMPATIAQKEFGLHFDYVDGKVIGYDKPRGAQNRTPLVDENGEHKAFEDAIAYLYQKHPESKSITKDLSRSGVGSATQSITDPITTSTGAESLTGLARIAKALDATRK